MKLSIKGYPKNTKKSSIRYAGQFFANELFSTRLNSKIIVNLSFDPEDIKRELNPEDWGSCYYLDDPFRPREFEVYIRPTLSRGDTYLTWAHEMSHVEQYARNRLYDYERLEDRTRWKRKVYVDYDNATKAEQLKYPWEIEAIKVEKILTDLLFDHVKEKFK